jgi:cation diffusion facilitator family transporter
MPPGVPGSPPYDPTPMAEHGHETNAIAAAFLANMGIAAAKFVGFAFTGSSSLLAESLHSVADTGNQALLMLGGRRARREATPRFSFGFGRERYFWSFVVALVLFTLGSVFAIYEGIHKLQHPELLESPVVAFVILGVAVVLEGLSLRTAIKESSEARGSMPWLRFLRRSKSPELPVVLLEDTGAECGLAIALIAITLSEVTGNARWDGVGTVLIGALLGVIAIFLAVEMKGLLIGESADEEVEQRIGAAIGDDDEVRDLIHLRTQHLGPEEVLVAAKVEFDHGLSGAALGAAVDRVEAAIRAAVPIVGLIYIEPDVRHEPDNAATGP